RPRLARCATHSHSMCPWLWVGSRNARTHPYTHQSPDIRETGLAADSRMRFRDKAVIVTGAAGGIGRASAIAFAAEGARLVIADTGDKLAETARLCRAQGAAVQALTLDVSADHAADML